jgi:hypothetical protein
VARPSATTSSHPSPSPSPPPDREGTDWNALGADAQDIRDFAIGDLNRRVNVIGVPLDTL